MTKVATGFKGVHWCKMQQLFRATVTKNRVVHPCGYHPTAREAAIARDKKIVALSLGVRLQVLKKLEPETQKV